MRGPAVGTLRAVLELTLALAASVGAAVSWSQVRYLVVVAPILDGQPETVSVAYHPPMVGAAAVCATAAGVLAVVGVARLHRSRQQQSAYPTGV